MAKTDLTAQRLRELVHYDPETGQFWKLPKSTARLNASAACMQLGCVNKHIGYVSVGVDKSHFYAHRLAWLYMVGELPKYEIDHINGIRTDNRFANLRDASRSLNAQNMRKANSANSTGFIGVTRYKRGTAKNRFVATIKTNRVRKYIGIFDTPEEAHAAYVTEKRIQHAGCTL